MFQSKKSFLEGIMGYYIRLGIGGYGYGFGYGGYGYGIWVWTVIFLIN